MLLIVFLLLEVIFGVAIGMVVYLELVVRRRQGRLSRRQVLLELGCLLMFVLRLGLCGVQPY